MEVVVNALDVEYSSLVSGVCSERLRQSATSSARYLISPLLFFSRLKIIQSRKIYYSLLRRSKRYKNRKDDDMFYCMQYCSTVPFAELFSFIHRKGSHLVNIDSSDYGSKIYMRDFGIGF